VSLVQKHAQHAYGLLSDRKRWTTGVLARDKEGDQVGACSPAAVCWCAEGAIERVTLGLEQAEALRDAVLQELGIRDAKSSATQLQALYEINDGEDSDDAYAKIVAAFKAVAERE
jgi:hypothetical protein